MAEQNPPGWLQTGGLIHPARILRRALAGVVTEGVCTLNPAGDLLVTAGAGMSVSVARGQAFIKGDDVTDQGLFVAYNDAAKVVSIAASDPTNDRIDLIVFHVKDATSGQAGDTSVVEVVAGTPSGAPVAPATPATALALARVLIPHGSSSVTSGNITDVRVQSGPAVTVTGNPVVRVSKQSADQTVPDSVSTAVTWDTVEDDDYGFYSSGSSDRLTVPSGLGGRYIIAANLDIEPQSGGTQRRIAAWKGSIGSTLLDRKSLRFTASEESEGGVVAIAKLSAGDFVTISAYQDSGSTIHVKATAGVTHFEMAKIG